MNTTNSVPTDSQQKITVESQLIYALWEQGRAYAGFEAHFEVKTLLVGDGGKVKATLYTDKGKKLGKVEGVMVCNRWRGRIVIPEKVKPDDFVYLEVELPKHRLSLDSNSIPVRPPIEVSSMKWSKSEVHRDEEVMMTCNFTNGVEEGDEVTVIVYEYDNDGNHDPVVKIPTVIKNNKVELKWNYIYQEDTDDIPTEEELQKYGKHYNPPEYFFVVMVDTVPVGNKQESGLLEYKDWVEIALKESGEPLADKEVKVLLADGREKKTTTDANGIFKLQDIPPGKVRFYLVEDEQTLADEQQLLDQSIQDEEAATEIEKEEVEVDDAAAGSDSGPTVVTTKEVDIKTTYDTEFLAEEQEVSDDDE